MLPRCLWATPESRAVSYRGKGNPIGCRGGCSLHISRSQPNPYKIGDEPQQRTSSNPYKDVDDVRTTRGTNVAGVQSERLAQKRPNVLRDYDTSTMPQSISASF